MEATHTKGPWSVAGGGVLAHPDGGAVETTQIEADGWGRIGDWYDTSNEGEANARLIAAAPELLEALEEARRVLLYAVQESAGKVKREIVGGWEWHAGKIDEVIIKAKGDRA